MSDELHKWSDKFRRTKDGKAAMNSLVDLDKNLMGDKDFKHLEFQTLILCYYATIYNDKMIKDLLEKKRAFKKAKKDHAKAIRSVQLFSNKYPAESGICLNKAFSKLKVKLPPLDDLSRPWGANLSSFLGLLTKEYGKQLDETDAFVSRFVGPFLYPKSPKDQTNFPDMAVVGLLFQLVVLFRDWTKTGKVHIHGTVSMPRHGKTCYHQAVLFVNAALKSNLDEKKARQRLSTLIKNNPGIKVGHFPNYQA